MARKPKLKGYSIVVADDLLCVSKDRIYDPDSDLDPENSFIDQFQCPVADEVLIALRKAFSLTFPRNPFIDGVQSALLEIRRIGVEALKPMPEILSELKLPPIPPIIDDPVLKQVRVFQFLFVRTSDFDVAVKVDGKNRRLLEVAQHEDGTPLLTTLRSVITDTFNEAHDEDQHMEILHRIRSKIWSMLPAFNACLESIEIEPIARQSQSSEEDGDHDVQG